MGTRRNKQIDSGRHASPGRVAVDSRGRNVWQWNDDQLDSTTIMLKQLDNSDLALEPTRQVRRPDGLADDNGDSAEPDTRRINDLASADLKIEQTDNIDIGGGFDPYNSS